MSDYYPEDRYVVLTPNPELATGPVPLNVYEVLRGTYPTAVAARAAAQSILEAGEHVQIQRWRWVEAKTDLAWYNHTQYSTGDILPPPLKAV